MVKVKGRIELLSRDGHIAYFVVGGNGFWITKCMTGFSDVVEGANIELDLPDWLLANVEWQRVLAIEG